LTLMKTLNIELIGAHDVDVHEKPEKKDDIDANFAFDFNSEYDVDAFELLSNHEVASNL
jgi:hypothetical protein